MTMSEIHRRMFSHFRGRYFWAAVTTAVCVTLIVGNATVISAASPPDEKFSRVSNPGTLVAIPPSADIALQRAVRNGEAIGAQHLLGTRGDRAFYRIGSRPNSDCFAVGPSGSAGYHFGAIRCANFPSTERPVLPFVVARGAAGEEPSIWRSEGFAADGVTSMVLQDAGGQVLARAPIEGNVFRFTSIPAGSTTLVGLNAKTEPVYSLPVGLE